MEYVLSNTFVKFAVSVSYVTYTLKRIHTRAHVHSTRGSKAAEGDGAAAGNFFAQQASFWEGWGASENSGLLIAPDGAGGEPEVGVLRGGKGWPIDCRALPQWLSPKP